MESNVNDESSTNNDLTPLQAQRSWDRQAEDNVADRLQRLGLIAPKGDVDKVLETVVNNLEVTNNRSDLLSVYGVARDLSALLRVDLAPMPVTDPEQVGDCVAILAYREVRKLDPGGRVPSLGGL